MRLADQLTIPNLLSMARIAAVPFIVVAMVQNRYVVALALFALSAVSDYFDGWLARRYHWTSRLGAFLDPAGDKLLLVAVYVTMAFPALPGRFHLPVWLTILVLSRDVLIVVVALVMFLALDLRSFPPSPLGRVATAVLLVDAGLALLANLRPMPVVIGEVVIWSAALVTVASGVDYIFRAARLSSASEPPAETASGADLT